MTIKKQIANVEGGVSSTVEAHYKDLAGLHVTACHGGSATRCGTPHGLCGAMPGQAAAPFAARMRSHA
jgi:hypothetical protein